MEGYFSRIIPANMAVRLHPEEIVIPSDFDLGEGKVKALHLRFNVQLRCCASTVNIINALSSRLRHEESDVLSASRAWHIDRLRRIHDDASVILQQLHKMNIELQSVPAKLSEDISKITGKGLLAAPVTEITKAPSPTTATATAPAGGASPHPASTVISTSGRPGLPGASRKALLYRVRYILPSWDMSGPSRRMT